MYCTVIDVRQQSIASQFEAELDVLAAEDPKGGGYFSLNLSLVDEFWYDFTYAKNKFTLQHEELDLPYYCAKAYIYTPGTDSYGPYDFAVDFDKGYLIFKESSNVLTSYVVASADPNVDPMEIAEHFSMFFQIYDTGSFLDGTITDFYFDMKGAWLREDGEFAGKMDFDILGEMDFYLTGTLPSEYKSGGEVQMELNFIWPESSGYRNEGPMTYTCQVDISEELNNHPNFHGTGTLRHAETNEAIPFAYNIFPYDSTVIIYMDGQYLIGTLNGTSQVKSRLRYFVDYIFTTSETN